jgi:hypothetical protein
MKKLILSALVASLLAVCSGCKCGWFNKGAACNNYPAGTTMPAGEAYFSPPPSDGGTYYPGPSG